MIKVHFPVCLFAHLEHEKHSESGAACADGEEESNTDAEGNPERQRRGQWDRGDHRKHHRENLKGHK